MASTPKSKTATSVGKSAQKNTKQHSPKTPKSAKQGHQIGKPKGTMGLSLLLIAIGTSLLGLGGLGYLFYQELLSSSQREMSQSAELQSTQIESKLNSVRQSADTVALNVKALFQQTPKQKTVDRYQKLVIDGVQKSDLVAGIGIVQNENLLFTVPKPTVPYVLKEQSGLKLEGATQKLTAPNDKLLVGNRSDFQNSPLYKSPATNSKESWSEPYSALGKTLVTYSSPILDGQKVLGVVNADAIASNLVAISNVSANSESKIGIVVVSASGRVITSSDQLATQLQNPATAEAIKNLVQQAKSQPTGIAQTGGNLWAYRKIQGSDWIVASSLPESEITNKLLLLVGGAAIGISTILAIAILSFINSLKKRLQPLTEECDRFLAQQGTTDLNLEGKDEIDRLGLSLKNTLQKAKNNELRLRSESNQTVDLDSSTSPQIQEDFVEAELTKEEVGNLLDVVSSMIEGDLTVEAEVNDRAAGLVSDTFNRLREKLLEVISSVLGTAQQVAQEASDLEALAQTVMLNTSEQAQSLVQGQTLAAQVVEIAQRSSEQVSIANQSLQKVLSTVTSGQAAIDNITENVTVLQTGSVQIGQRMKTLSEFVALADQFVQDRGQITQLIQVLAHNASLAASRALEQKDSNHLAGVAREFEAISDQINDLATQTNEGLTFLQQRTSQIQTVVAAIDAEVQNLSGLVSGFTTDVESSQLAFHSIQLATEEVSQIGQTITSSSLEITDAAGSTANYFSEVAQLADRTADLTRTARQHAETMGNQAQQLLEGIQFFRLPAGTTYAKEAAATATTISQSGNPNEDYTASEDVNDNTAADNQYLQSILDEGIREDSNDYAISVNHVPENAISEENAVNNFLNTPSHDQSPADANIYSELTDTTVIEESLLASLRVEIANELAELEDISGQEEKVTEPPSTFKNSLEGIDEFSISESSSDPLIESAVSSFMRDTDFGNLSSSSKKSSTNLSASVDFSIPDLDDHDFELSNIDIESMLDNSNLFFDANQAEPTDDVELNFDPFVIEQSTADANYNATTDNYESTADDTVDFNFDNFSASAGDDDDYKSSLVFSQPSNESLESLPNEAFNDIFDNIFDEEPFDFAQSTNESLESLSNEAFDDTFDNIFDEDPFDFAFDKALSSPNMIDPSLESSNDNFGNKVNDQFESSSSEDHDSYDQFDSSANIESNVETNFLDDQLADLTSEFTEEVNAEETANFSGLPSAIPDIYLEDVAEQALPDEFDFEENLSVESSHSNLDDSSNIFDEPSFESPTEKPVDSNIDFGDPFYVADFSELSDSDNLIEQQNYLFTETAIAPEANIQENNFFDSALEKLHEESTFDLDDYATNSDLLETPPSIFEDNFAEANIGNTYIDNIYENVGEFAKQFVDSTNISDQLDQLEVSTDDLDLPSFYDESVELADNFESDNLSTQADDFVREIAIAPDIDQQALPIASASLDEYSTGFNSDLQDNDSNPEEATTSDIIQPEVSPSFTIPSPQLAISDFSSNTLTEEGVYLNISDELNFLTLNQETQISSLEVHLDEGIVEDASLLTDDTIYIDNWDKLPDLVTETSYDDFSTIAQADLTNEISPETTASPEERAEWEEEAFFDSLSTVSIEDHTDFLTERIESLENSQDINVSDIHVKASDLLVNPLNTSTSDIDIFLLEEESSVSLNSSDNDSFDFSGDWLDEMTLDHDQPHEQNIDGLDDLSLGEYSSNSVNDLESDNSVESNYRLADDLLDSFMNDSDPSIEEFSSSFPDLFLDNYAVSSENAVDIAKPMEMLSDGVSEDSESEFDFNFSTFDELIDGISSPTPANLDSLNSNASNADSSSNSIAARAEIEEFLSGALGLEERNDETSSFQDNVSIKPDQNRPNTK
ncbi:MAG: hypothetical protein ACK5RM_16260 [Pseudanabaena sp.]